MAKVNQFFR